MVQAKNVAIQLQYLRENNDQGKGGDSQIRPGEPEGRDTDQKADEAGEKAGEKDGGKDGHPGVDHQNGAYVGADGNEGGMSERYLAAVPGEQVEAHEDDQPDGEARRLAVAEVGKDDADEGKLVEIRKGDQQDKAQGQE